MRTLIVLVGPIVLVLLSIDIILSLRTIIGSIDTRRLDEEEDQPRPDGR
jgi:hypothetical protein